MTERRRVHEAAARVRGLLEKLAAPHPALQRIVEGADAHVASLSPHLSLLDVSPFGALPEVMPQAHGPTDDVSPRRRRIEAPEQSAARRFPPRAEPVEETTRRVAEHSPAPKRVVTPVFPIGTGKARPARDSAAHQESATRAFTPVQQAAGVPAREAMRIPERERTTARHVAAPVDLGALVERVLRHARGAAQTRSVDHTGSSTTTRRVQAEPARTAVRRAPTETHALLPSRDPRNSAEHESVVRREAIIAADGARPSHTDAAVQPSAQPAHKPPVFYFDPLQPRAPADDSDDALAERIGEVLREQARRQGVDVT